MNFFNRIPNVILSLCLMGINPVWAQQAYLYRDQIQKFAHRQAQDTPSVRGMEDPYAALINQAKQIREALLPEKDSSANANADYETFAALYQQELQQAFEQAKQQAQGDPQALNRLELQHKILASRQTLDARWEAYENDDLSAQDAQALHMQLVDFTRQILSAYQETKRQDFLQIIEEDFPLYAQIGAIEEDVRQRSAVILRKIVFSKAPQCAASKHFSAAGCNAATVAAAALSVLGDFTPDYRSADTDFQALQSLLQNAYDGPMAYHAGLLAAGALLAAGRSGPIIHLLQQAATKAQSAEKTSLLSVQTWVQGIQNTCAEQDCSYIMGYEQTFYDISGLQEGSGCVLTDLGEYLAEEALQGNKQAQSALDSIARLTLTPIGGENPRFDLKIAPFWAGAIGAGYVVHDMGAAGTYLDEHGQSFTQDTRESWQSMALFVQEEDTDFTGYLAYMLYRNKKAAVNPWAALYVNNRLAAVVEQRYPAKTVSTHVQPSKQQFQRYTVQHASLKAAPWADFVLEWAAFDLALTGGFSTVKSIAKAPQMLKALRLKNLQRTLKTARLGLQTQWAQVKRWQKLPTEVQKRYKRIYKALRKKNKALHSQLRKDLRLQMYNTFAKGTGMPGLTMVTEAAEKSADILNPVLARRQKIGEIIQMSGPIGPKMSKIPEFDQFLQTLSPADQAKYERLKSLEILTANVKTKRALFTRPMQESDFIFLQKQLDVLKDTGPDVYSRIVFKDNRYMLEIERPYLRPFTAGKGTERITSHELLSETSPIHRHDEQVIRLRDILGERPGMSEELLNSPVFLNRSETFLAENGKKVDLVLGNQTYSAMSQVLAGNDGRRMRSWFDLLSDQETADILIKIRDSKNSTDRAQTLASNIYKYRFGARKVAVRELRQRGIALTEENVLRQMAKVKQETLAKIYRELYAQPYVGLGPVGEEMLPWDEDDDMLIQNVTVNELRDSLWRRETVFGSLANVVNGRVVNGSPRPRDEIWHMKGGSPHITTNGTRRLDRKSVV